MFILAIVAGLAALLGVGLIVKEVHEITEEPSFPMIAVGIGLLALAFLVKAVRE